MSKVLVLCAHPDDELLGMGPVILQLIAEGTEVHLMAFTENSTRHGLAPIVSRERFYLSGAKLGAATCSAWEYPDQSLDRQPFTEIVARIEAALNMHQPDAVYVHSAYDLNRDHRIVNEAARVACRHMEGALLEYRTLSSSEWEFGGNFVSNMVFPVSLGDIEKAWGIFARVYPDEVQDAPKRRNEQAFREWFCPRGIMGPHARLFIRQAGGHPWKVS